MMELFVLHNSSELTVSVCNNRKKQLKDLEDIKDTYKVWYLWTTGLVEVSFKLKSSYTQKSKFE